jgi:hypothetical protein
MMTQAIDETIPKRGLIGAPDAVPVSPAERAARIDALMALPIKRRPQITIFGDDDVVGINPAPPTAKS